MIAKACLPAGLEAMSGLAATVDVICAFDEKQQQDPSLAWYSKQELISMRRDFDTRSMHYKTLRHRYPEVDFLGIQDARLVAQKLFIKIKLQIQCILLHQEQSILPQQDIHRELFSELIRRRELLISQLLALLKHA